MSAIRLALMSRNTQGGLTRRRNQLSIDLDSVKSHAKDAPSSLAIHLRLSLASDAFSRDVNCCFSESRAANGGINGTNRRLGMSLCGTLAQPIIF